MPSKQEGGAIISQYTQGYEGVSEEEKEWG